MSRNGRAQIVLAVLLAATPASARAQSGSPAPAAPAAPATPDTGWVDPLIEAARGGRGGGAGAAPAAPAPKPARPEARTAKPGGRFPHADHVGLFPLCTGCHRITTAASRADLYPAATICEGCHDGKERDKVGFSPQENREGAFFSHERHVAASGIPIGGNASCAGCHSAKGQPAMRVRRLAVERCIDCHVHDPRAAKAPAGGN